MPFHTEDHFTLSQNLNAIAVPMFAAERTDPTNPFHFICVNNAHREKTGLNTDFIRNKRPSDVLSPKDAANVQHHYARCAQSGQPMTYHERLLLNGTTSDWNTTLQLVLLPDGRERIIGTAIALDRAPICDALDDAAYYSAVAQMQVGKLRQFLTVLEKHRDVPTDMRAMAMTVGNITNSIDVALDDIRALSAPPKIGFPLHELKPSRFMH